MRRLLFLAEANGTIGRGHIARCLAIASMIDDLVNIHFICNLRNKTFTKQYIGRYKLVTITSYEHLNKIINDQDVVWIDNYEIDQNIKSTISVLAYKVIETNDIPYNNKHIDILINHTPGISSTLFPKNLKCAYYLGLQYSLLRPRFLEYARTNKSQQDGIGIFICFGGADTFDLGYNYTMELLQSEFQDPIYWVRSSNDKKQIKHKRLTTLEELSEDEMIKYMLKAKILLIPSSVLSIEAIALRRPIFTTNFVSNQDLIYKGLIELSLAHGIPTIQSKKQVKNSLSTLIDFYFNTQLHNKQLKKQIYTLDGNTNIRVRELILKAII